MLNRKKRQEDVTDDESGSVSSNGTPTTSKTPIENPTKTRFQRGDHVYRWCSVAGIPRVYQHHGIVMHVEIFPGPDEGEVTQRLTIADFSNFLPESSATPEQQPTIVEETNLSSPENKKDRPWSKKHDKLSESSASLIGGGMSTGGILRVYTISSNDSPWHKVEYNAARWKTLLCRSGVSTTVAASDSPEEVLNRVNFLLCHQSERESNDTFRSSVLPKYHLLFANCECVAMWCKTGRFCTLQGASFLAGATWAKGLGTVAIGQAATVQEAAVVAPGLMGASTSFTTLASSQPWFVTAATAYGAMTIGGCVGTLVFARAKWNATTRQLNDAINREAISVTITSS